MSHLRKVTVTIEAADGTRWSYAIAPRADGQQVVSYGKGIRERVSDDPSGARVHEHDGTGWLVISVAGDVVAP